MKLKNEELKGLKSKSIYHVFHTLAMILLIFVLAFGLENIWGANPVGREKLPEQVRDWSEAALGSLPGTREIAQDFARAHVGHKLFGPRADWVGPDAILVELLEGKDPLQPGLIEAYADKFDTICAVPASEATHIPPQVMFREPFSTWRSIEKGIAIITPGNDTPFLPEGTEVVVVDLRRLAPGAKVKAAASLALATEVSLGKRWVRAFNGFPQQAGSTHYHSKEKCLELVVPKGGEKDLPLYFLTGQRLTPEAATIAGGLRLAGRAGLIGYNVFSSVAESTWTGIGDRGLLWRSSMLEYDGQPWPDVIPVDISTTKAEDHLGRLDEINISGKVSGKVSRPAMEKYDRLAGQHDDRLSQGAMRAALLVAYGTFDWFYQLFTVVGREMDESFLEAMAEVEKIQPNDRREFIRTFSRFLHDLYDSHGRVTDEGPQQRPDGRMRIQIQGIKGMPVVRVSAHEDIKAGDTIVAIDGVPAAEWYAEAMSRYSGATDGNRFTKASSELKNIYGTRRLTLRSPSGVERTVTVEPRPSSEMKKVPYAGTFRKNGWLADLGAPKLYYVNLSNELDWEPEKVMAQMPDIIREASGFVLDMRAYPKGGSYELTRHFNPRPYKYPMFENGTWNGPSQYALAQSIWWEYDPAEPIFDGPVVLLVSNKTLSFAETLSMAVELLDNVTVMGQQSAGSNGTITNIRLPGRLKVVFTGERFIYPDGTEFHGIGIQPDIEVVPTPAQFAAGEDPELEAAIKVLLGK